MNDDNDYFDYSDSLSDPSDYDGSFVFVAIVIGLALLWFVGAP